jgi:hypothetical protein
MAPVNPTGTRAASPADARPAEPTTRTEKGMSLARGPALILGTVLTAVGLYLLYKARTFPPFSNFPNGDAAKDGNFLFGIFGANGWTGMLTAAGGGLLLFGAAQHLLAKTMSLIVGVALGAAAVIALISGNVLGMAAANGWTKLGWAICAAILLFNTLVPRRRRTVVVADREPPVAYDRRPVATDDATAVRRDPVVAHDAPTTVRRDEESTAVRRDEESTAVRRDEESTAVRRDEEPTAVRRDEEPAELDRSPATARTDTPRD